MGAMQEEVALLRNHMSGMKSETSGMREYISGQVRGKSVTIVFSRWGKVSASSTATTLIERFGANFLVFTGIAGALDKSLNIGDIVIADTLVQHDMDASILPGIGKFEIPLLNISLFTADQRYTTMARRAAESYLAKDLKTTIPQDVLEKFNINTPQVVTGTIASGDQFIANDQIAQNLREQLPDLKCVEMEGAAVAQVAYEHGIPCLVLRTISDKANHRAITDFPLFVGSIASHFTCGLVLRLLDVLRPL